MANKRERDKIIQKNLTDKYNKALNKQFPYYVAGLVALAVAIVCYLFNWVYIYNTASGIEVKVSGFSFLISAITGKYTDASKIYGDIAVPFFYYAETYCKQVGILTLITAIVHILALASCIILVATKKHMLSFVSSVLSLVCSVLLFVVFVCCLSMKNSEILPVYCSGNPNCFIRSLVIISAITVFCGAVLQIIALVKTLMLTFYYKKALKQSVVK